MTNEQLALERRKEAFAHRIIEAVVVTGLLLPGGSTQRCGLALAKPRTVTDVKHNQRMLQPSCRGPTEADLVVHVAGTGNNGRKVAASDTVELGDADVNMTERTQACLGDLLFWNALGQLDLTQTYNNGTLHNTAIYQYDGLGRRVFHKSHGDTIRSVWDGDVVIAEGDTTKRISARLAHLNADLAPMRCSVALSHLPTRNQAGGRRGGELAIEHIF